MPAPDIDFPPYSPDIYGSTLLFEILDFLLPFHTIPLNEAPLLQRLAAINVGPYSRFDIDDFDSEIRTALQEGVEEAHRSIEKRGRSLGTVVDGWQDIPRMGHYGDDYLFRSAVAWKFIYTNSPEEALYPIAETDSDGEQLHGSNRYLLQFAPGAQPPVDAFWSLTLYESESRLMTENPIGRYSIGDRTPGLRYGPDGSLTLYIQHESPGSDHESNWLPAPPGGFYLNARAYMPQQSMLDGGYRLPAVTKAP